MLQSMNKLIDTSKGLLQELQTDAPTSIASTATSPAEKSAVPSSETSPAKPTAPGAAAASASSSSSTSVSKSDGGGGGNGKREDGAGTIGGTATLPQPQDILSGLKAALKVGSVEPASAAELEQGVAGTREGTGAVGARMSGTSTIEAGSIGEEGGESSGGDGDGPLGGEEGGRVDVVAVAAANLLNLLDGKENSSESAASFPSGPLKEKLARGASSSPASSLYSEQEGRDGGSDGGVGGGAGGAREGGGGIGGNMVRRFQRRWKESDPSIDADGTSSSSDAKKEALRALAAGGGDPARGLADTFAWVQQVAEEKVSDGRSGAWGFCLGGGSEK